MTRVIFSLSLDAEAADLTDWVHTYLSRYDLTLLDQIRIVGKEGSAARPWQGVHGYCEYPRRRGRRRQGFRIYCEAEGPYPYTLHASGTRIRNVREAVAWIVGHEAHHFLCESGQVVGRNSEPEANAAGKAAVRHYRAFARRQANARSKSRSSSESSDRNAARAAVKSPPRRKRA